jgi:DNA-binding response OmpR family regulator
MKTILIIEDDPDIVRLLAHYLEPEGYRIRSEANGIDGLRAARDVPPAVVILDVMLPGMDGYEVCKRLRGGTATAALPILMLTAKGDETEKIVGLEIGADDYVTKPFSPKEVVARVKALLRRSETEAPSGRVRYGVLTLDADRHEVAVDGRPVDLTAKEFGLLQYLLQRPGRLATRDALLDAVWGYDADVTTRTIDVHIRRLREKIPLLAAAILTVKPYGYKLRDEAEAR